MPDPGWRPTSFHRGAVICGGVFYAVIVALLVPRLDALEREVLLARNIGLLVVLALPLALAIVSLFARPMLLLPAAIFSILVSPMMWSGLPLVLIPGVVYIVAFSKADSPPSSALQIAGAIVIPVALGLTAFGLLFSSTTQTCAGEGNGSMSQVSGGGSGTGGTVEPGGSFRSVCADAPSATSVGGTVLVVVAAVAASTYVSTPQRSLPAVSPAGR